LDVRATSANDAWHMHMYIWIKDQMAGLVHASHHMYYMHVTLLCNVIISPRTYPERSGMPANCTCLQRETCVCQHHSHSIKDPCMLSSLEWCFPFLMKLVPTMVRLLTESFLPAVYCHWRESCGTRHYLHMETNQEDGTPLSFRDAVQPAQSQCCHQWLLVQ
jgi:hypothetical protein